MNELEKQAKTAEYIRQKTSMLDLSAITNDVVIDPQSKWVPLETVLKAIADAKKNTFLVFRNGKLITVVQSTVDNYDSAIDGDYVIDNPQEAEKQITQWRSEH